MKSVWCDRALFLGPYYCLVTTEALFRRELKKLGIHDALEYTKTPTSNATCFELESNGKTAFIVTLKGWESTDPIEVAGLIVHEATHIKQHIMRIIGETAPSNEFEAYMMQNIAQNLMQCFVEQTRK